MEDMHKTTDPGETMLMGDIPTTDAVKAPLLMEMAAPNLAAAPKKRAPRGAEKPANPLADAKAEIKMLNGKVEMLDSQLKAAFTRTRQYQENIETLQVKLQNAEEKMNLVNNQLVNTLNTIRLGGR